MLAAQYTHEPVLVDAVLAHLAPRPGSLVVDATVGGGGHTALLAARGARVIGLDRDPAALEAAAARLEEHSGQVELVHANFAHLGSLLDELGVDLVDGVLFDLGVSSPQFDDPERGFTYRADVALDMRMDRGQPTTAYHLVNGLSERELVDILRRYGEEPWANRIAAFIVRTRERRGPLETTGDLVRVVLDAIPASARRSGGHPARRTFQALRIAVNDELGALRSGLEQAADRLGPDGRLVAISFHSLEDREVKRFVRGDQRLQSLTRHPVEADEAERQRNPRARSAKLRAARRREAVNPPPAT